jgi:hypothetical protein
MSKLDDLYSKLLASPKVGAARSSALKVTQEMLDVAKGNKAIVVVPFPAVAFLKLTTPSDQAIKEIADETKSVAFYNSKEAGIIVMPNLKIEMGSGKIISHEGRHRAAALIKENGLDVTMDVAIAVTKDGYATYYEQFPVKPPDYANKKRYRGVEDVPTALRGEFRPTKHALDLSQARELWK